MESEHAAESNGQSSAKQFAMFMLILMLGMILFHGPLLWQSQVVCGGDIVNQFGPMLEGQLRRGWFTGWQPETFAGWPVLQDPQSGVFYPPNWILAATRMPVFRFLTASTMLHLIVGGMGFFLFARRSMESGAAILASMLWTFGGYQLQRLTNGVMVFTEALAWVPFMLLAAERQSFAREGLAWIAVLSLAAACQLTTGGVQIAQIIWVGLGFWTLARIAFSSSLRERIQIGGGFLFAGILALLIAAPYLRAVTGFIAEAWKRGGGDLLAYLSDGSLRPALLASWIAPEVFGPGNIEGLYWGSKVGFSETNGFFGVIPVLLAVFGIWNWRGADVHDEVVALRKRWLMGLSVAAIFGFLVALGSHGFLFPLLVRFVPTFDLFRVPARWMLWVAVAGPLLAGWGWEALSQSSWVGSRYRAWIVIAAAMTALLALARSRYLDALQVLGLGDRGTGTEALISLHEYAASSLAWALTMAGAALGAGILLSMRMLGRGLVLAVLALLIFADVYRGWIPFSKILPKDIEPQALLSEAPFHRIGAADAEAYFYPESKAVTELMKLVAETPGRIHTSPVFGSYMFDQLARELQNERPAWFGFEFTRGYQQLRLASYVRDFIASLSNPVLPDPGAFLLQGPAKDRRFYDAYNVRYFITYPVPELDEELQRLGMTHAGSIGEFDMQLWKNPGARGWAWLSPTEGFLDAEPHGASVTFADRAADHWKGAVTAEAGDILHLSSPDFKGWTLIATHEDDTAGTVIDSRSIRLPKAGKWTFERTFHPAGLGAAWLATALIGAFAAMGLLIAGARTTVRSPE